MTDTKNEWAAERDRLEHAVKLLDLQADRAVAMAKAATAECVSMGKELTAARARIEELEKAEASNLRAIGEASGAMYEPDTGPTWPGSWAEQVSVIRGLRESQRHETDRFLRIEELVRKNGCDCPCSCSVEEHYESCRRCFACKVDAALRGVSL